ncbi:hypothetical protein B9Z19DRAFT_1127601 [Tuber borchii]|uniref:Uncharacterized protein n=1 Tax=Tuber borchii TaxID=42251 RepID=A0A2T6ZQY5_TUBBO|nr:hypothetical protein B9Z19DRAFT_1127601 [Tuber borchii]
MPSSDSVLTKQLPKDPTPTPSLTTPIQTISILRSPDKPRSSQKKSVRFSVENPAVDISDGKPYLKKYVMESELPHRNSNGNLMDGIPLGFLIVLTGIIATKLNVLVHEKKAQET